MHTRAHTHADTTHACTHRTRLHTFTHINTPMQRKRAALRLPTSSVATEALALAETRTPSAGMCVCVCVFVFVCFHVGLGGGVAFVLAGGGYVTSVLERVSEELCM